MPYSGYIVRYQPDRLATVLAALKSYPDVTIGEPASSGLQLAATTSTSEEAMVLNERLERLPGVLNVALLYHNFEDVDEPPKAMPKNSERAVPDGMSN